MLEREKRMAILNYTTTIPVKKTISEIEQMLATSGANKILKDYDNKGNVTSLSFIFSTEKGMLAFKLPMKSESVLQTLKNQSNEYKNFGYRKRRVIPQSSVNIEQASRVGWRIIKDWLEAQLALYFLQMVKFEEIFLPYMCIKDSDKTMFQLLEENGFDNLLELKE